MNRSRRRRLALRVLAVSLGLGLLGFGGVALADDSGSTVAPGNTVIAPVDAPPPPMPPGHIAVPNDTVWN